MGHVSWHAKGVQSHVIQNGTCLWACKRGSVTYHTKWDMYLGMQKGSCNVQKGGITVIELSGFGIIQQIIQ